MSTPHTTGSFPQALLAMGTHWFGLAQKQLDEQYSKLCEMRNSNSKYEYAEGYVGLGVAQRLREGENITFDSTNQGYSITTENVEYGLGYRCTSQSILYNKFPQLMKQRSMDLVHSHSRVREIVVASLLNNAFSSSYPRGGDGVELCSSANVYHRTGETWANEPSSAYDISEWAIEQLVNQIRDTRDERGNKIALMPRRLILPVALEAEALRITGAPEQYGTAERNLNAMHRLGWFKESPLVMNYLTDSDAWFIQTDANDGFVFYNVKSPEFENDRDFHTGDYLYKATQIFSCDVLNKRCVFGSEGGS